MGSGLDELCNCFDDVEAPGLTGELNDTVGLIGTVGKGREGLRRMLCKACEELA